MFERTSRSAVDVKRRLFLRVKGRLLRHFLLTSGNENKGARGGGDINAPNPVVLDRNSGGATVHSGTSATSSDCKPFMKSRVECKSNLGSIASMHRKKRSPLARTKLGTLKSGW